MGKTQEVTRIHLGQALALFEEHIDDIKQACEMNTLYVLKDNKKRPRSGNDTLDWVRDGVREICIKERVEPLQRVLKRIASVKKHKRNPHMSRITDEDIERAREVPLTELYDGELRKTGRSHVGLCPFHNEKTPSFHIYDNRYKCYGCGEYGDSIQFVMMRDGVDFIKAIKVLI